MSTLTKQQFLSRPKISGKPKAEKERLWKNYISSSSKHSNRPRAPRAAPRPRRTRNPAMLMHPERFGTTINPRWQQMAMNRDQMAVAPTSRPLRVNRRGRRMGLAVSAASTSGTAKLSSCGKAYITSLVNPFSHLDAVTARSNTIITGNGNMPLELPCVPTWPAVKSRRHKIFVRGTASTDSAGSYSIVMAPRRAANNYSLTVDSAAPLIFSNGSGVIGPNFGTYDTGAALNAAYTAVNFNSDYGSTQLSTFTTGRLVCGGMRIRYDGAEQTMAGVIHSLQEPNHNSLSAMGVSTISPFEGYFRSVVSKTWVYQIYTPVHPEEYAYSGDFATGFIAPQDNHYMGFLVQGAPASTTFEYEAMAIIELCGGNIRDLKQAKSDQMAMDIATNGFATEKQGQLNNDGFAKTLGDVVKVGGEISTIVGGMGKFLAGI